MDDVKRREDDVAVSELLRLMRSLMGDFRSQANAIIDVQEKLSMLLAAFPEGGLVQHRLDHERMMAENKSAAALREGVARNIISGGAWATILVVAYALWDYLKAHIK